MTKLNETIGQILDISVVPGKYPNYALLLDRSGRPTRFEANKIIFALCSALEQMQNDLEVMKAQKLPLAKMEELSNKYEEGVKNAPSTHRTK